MSAISVQGGTATTEAEPAESSGEAKRKRKRTKHPKLPLRVRFRRDWPLLLMAIPAVLLVFAFNYLPMFGSVTAFEYAAVSAAGDAYSSISDARAPSSATTTSRQNVWPVTAMRT